MTLAVDVALEGVRAGVSKAELARAAEYALRAEGVRHAVVSIALVTPAAMARMNRRHLGHAGATDVIAFSHDVPRASRAAIIADVYVCPAVARTNARRFDASVRAELLRLVIHGVLHATGWDHPDGEDRTASPMWKRQERLLAAFQRRPT